MAERHPISPDRSYETRELTGSAATEVERPIGSYEQIARGMDNKAERVRNVTRQLNDFCDRIHGAQPSNLSPQDGAERETPHSAFQRVEISETELNEAVVHLEGALGRIDEMNL